MNESKNTMSPFPRGAWAALAAFSPDRLLSLALRFDKAGAGSPERRQVQTEIEEFEEEFKAFAAASIAEERRSDLARVVELTKTKRHLEKQCIDKCLRELLEKDLTLTEMMRLRRLLDERINPAFDKMSEALEALAQAKPVGSAFRGSWLAKEQDRL
jgi:hypothetical protein